MTKSVYEIRKDFPIFSTEENAGYIYLDNAATTQKPRAVLDAIGNFYINYNANVYRAIHRWGEESTRHHEEARKKVARFINARESREIIFTSGTTDSINLIASSFCRAHTSAGDEIILTEMEHHSNIVPWQITAQQYGLKLKYIPVKSDGTLELDVLPDLWSEKTRIVAITHMSNVLGTVNHVKTVIRQAHERGIPVLLDAAQTVPHMAVDVRDLDCDFLAFSGHKMCGPTGIGVLYGKAGNLEKFPPWKGGGEMIRSVYRDHSDWNTPFPHKFEAGTPNIAGAIGLGAAVDYLTSIGMDRIRSMEEELTDRLLKGLENIRGIRVFGKAPVRGGIAAFEKEGVHSHDLVHYLDTKGIALRAGHHCAHILAKKLKALSTARASLYFYNTPEEVDRLLEILSDADDLFI